VDRPFTFISGPDGDGQYLHYLTKWAFALLQARGPGRFNSVASLFGD
jgi:hypothetical protein